MHNLVNIRKICSVIADYGALVVYLNNILTKDQDETEIIVTDRQPTTAYSARLYMTDSVINKIYDGVKF